MGGTTAASSLLLFDIEAIGEKDLDAETCYRLWEVRQTLAVVGVPQTHFEAKLLQDVRAFKEVDTVVLAARLAAVGYRVAIRTAVGGGTGQECFHNLHYEFLLVTGDDFTEHIVDPRFREQFQISQSTEEYQDVLSLVPAEYVGTAARLVPIVKLLCAEMQQSFRQTGLTCPPWRHADSMVSKWVPTKARDMEVASPSSSPEGRYGKSLVGLSPRGPLSRSNSGATSSTSASSIQSSISRQSSMPAKPLVRQAGFKPSALSASLALKRQGKSLDSSRDALKAGRAAILPGNISGGDAQIVDDWQAPRIRTVKMTGNPAR